VIDTFLHQYEHIRSNVVCDLGIAYQLCEGAALKKKYNLVAPNSGVLVTRVNPIGSAKSAGVQVGDILMAINDCKIANDGTVRFRGDERVGFSYLITSLYIGEEFSVTLLRESQVITTKTIGQPYIELVPRHLPRGVPPSWFLFGGILFSPVTYGLLDVAVESLQEEPWQAGRNPKQTEDEQVVIIVSVLSHPVNHGNDVNRLPQCVAVNGAKVRNIRQIKEEVDKIESGFVEFKLADGKLIVLDVAACRAAETEIMQTYAVPSPCSPELLVPKAMVPKNELVDHVAPPPISAVPSSVLFPSGGNGTRKTRAQKASVSDAIELSPAKTNSDGVAKPQVRKASVSSPPPTPTRKNKRKPSIAGADWGNE
jgi:hypothetical protein